LRIALVSTDVALVTYFAEVEIPEGDHSHRAQFVVGEVWVKRRDEWLCRYYQGILRK
jgi:ketosteroid isomerase-like protein